MLNECSLYIDTLVNSTDPEEYYRGFLARFAHFFNQFLLISSGIFHHKVVGVRLFKQERLFDTIRYMGICRSCHHQSSDVNVSLGSLLGLAGNLGEYNDGW